jgi:hypothetical protein
LKREEVIEVGNKKTVGIVLLVVGIIVLAVSLLADTMGIGRSDSFGYYQIGGVVVGVVVAAVGLYMAFKN